MKTRILVFDDTMPLAGGVAGMLAVSSYSDIYYRKKTLAQWMAGMSGDAGFEFVSASDPGIRNRISTAMNTTAPAECCVVYMPAHFALGCPELEARDFFERLALARNSLRVMAFDGHPQKEPQCVVLHDAAAVEGLREWAGGADVSEVFRHSADGLPVVPAGIRFIDLRDSLQFTDYLTSNFDVRYFNSVRNFDEHTLIKSSSDRAKLSREFAYHGFLPPELKMFFVEPFDYQDSDKVASYRMERLFVPDMALQWIHGSVGRDDFRRFLSKVFYYLNARPQKRVSRQDAEAKRDSAYLMKVRDRVAELKLERAYATLQPHFDAAFGGIDRLMERYESLYFADSRIAPIVDLSMGHGDLCFSNILYGKSTGLMRLIDPRGASEQSEMYVDPYYDVAKLSHSIQGGYDFINHGLTAIELGADLKPMLKFPLEVPTWAIEQFHAFADECGFNQKRIRLYEASLFISMAPLHIDHPQKVLQFLINAEGILNILDPSGNKA